MRIALFIIECFFWAVVGIVVLFVLAFVFAVGLAPVFAALSPFLAVFLMVVIARAVARARRRRGQLVLMYLEQALRLNLPLPQAIDAAARSERGAAAGRLFRLSQALSAGSSVGDAVARHVPEVPWRTASLLMVAERLGRLPRTVGRIVERRRRAIRDESTDPLSAVAYGMVVSLFLVLILVFVGVFILPRFQEIFMDFDMELPWPTIFTLTVLPDVTAVVGPLALLFAIGLLGWTMWTIRHGGGAGLAGSAGAGLTGLTDRLIWITPVWGGLVRDRGLAEVSRIAAEALDARCPLDEAFDRAATIETNAVLQNRLHRLAERVRSGATIGQAAAVAHLPRLYRDMLATLDTGGDPAGVLRFLASYYDSRLSRAAMLLRAAAVPAVVILLAGVVGWVVVSLFLPLVILIDSLTPYWSAV